MSKFCEKCGNQLNDDDVFCEKCGTRVESGKMTNSTDTAQSVSGSVSQQATVQPEVVILQKKKMNPLKIIIPIVSGVLVVTLVIALVMMLGKSVVKTSKDGKKVFAFNPKEFVERYNKTNADVLTSEFDFSSFEYDTNSDGDDLYKRHTVMHRMCCLQTERVMPVMLKASNIGMIQKKAIHRRAVLSGTACSVS